MIKANLLGASLAWVLCVPALATPLSPAQHDLLQGFLKKGCLKRTPVEADANGPNEEQVNRFCDCASQYLASTFTSEEVMGVLTGQIKKDDPRGQQRLQEATEQCSPLLSDKPAGTL